MCVWRNDQFLIFCMPQQFWLAAVEEISRNRLWQELCSDPVYKIKEEAFEAWRPSNAWLLKKQLAAMMTCCEFHFTKCSTFFWGGCQPRESKRYAIVVQFLVSKIGSTSIIRSSGVMTCWRIVGSGWSGLSHQIARSPDHPSSAVQFRFITMSMEPCRWFDSADMTTNPLSRHGQRLEVNGVSFQMSRALMLPTTPVTACSSWRSMTMALSRQSTTPTGLIERESLSFKPYVRCTLFAFFYLSLDFFILFFHLSSTSFSLYFDLQQV